MDLDRKLKSFYHETLLPLIVEAHRIITNGKESESNGNPMEI